MSKLRELAYQIDPALWVRKVLGVEPAPWQEQFLRAPLGASIIALTARQVGKTTTAAWAIAHYMLFTPGSLSVIACPAQRQSKEAVRRVRETLLRVGAELKSDNIYELELKNGSRVMALPSTLQMANVLAPFALASRIAPSVSAVSPDWEMATQSVSGVTSGSR